MSLPIAAVPADATEIVAALNQLVRTCMDSEKGYAEAAADVRDPVLKDLFLARAKERSDYVVVLQRAIETLGAVAENEGTAWGALHRGWIEIRRVFEGRSDAMIVEECELGERSAKASYDAVFKRVPLARMPGGVRDIVHRQYTAVLDAIVEIQQARRPTSRPERGKA